MIYAFRDSEFSRSLEEFPSQKAMDAYVAAQAATDGGVQVFSWRRVRPDVAHQWVRRGNLHNTGLWTDHDGKVRYARAQYD